MTHNDVLHSIMNALETSGWVVGECSHGIEALDAEGKPEPEDRSDYAVFCLRDKDSGEEMLCSLYARDIGITE